VHPAARLRDGRSQRAWSSVELKTLVYPQVQMRATLYTVSPSPVLFTF